MQEFRLLSTINANKLVHYVLSKWLISFVSSLLNWAR